jgi:RimJ/RimL family protein N-acetyltransferase
VAVPVILDTPRLRLRQWRDDDLAPFARMNADPRVMEHFPAPLERAASDAVAMRLRDEIAERGWGFWAVEAKDGAGEGGGGFVGFTGLRIPAVPLPIGPCVEIGWRLAHAHWGRGYASEAARAALGYGFGVLGLAEIVSFTALQNVRSQAVMQRIGMVQRGEVFEHPGVAPGHPLRAHCLYRLTRAEWARRA